ncbi:MAG: zinc transporter ZntB [Alcanivoracaceae bacterium]
MSGLVHGFVLDGQGGARRIAADADVEGVRWLHFDYTHADTATWLDSQVPERVAAALLTMETRPRVTALDDGVLVYLRGVNLNPGEQPEDMIAIRLWLRGNQVYSTQRRSLAAVRSLQESFEQGEGPRTAGELLASLIDRLTWNLEEVIEAIEDQVAVFDRPGDASSRQTRARLAALRRRAIILRRYLNPQREAIIGLQADASGLLSDSDKVTVREAGDRLQRLLEDLDSAREQATLAQEAMNAVLSDQLNQRMYLLAILTGIFLPASFLTGLFGINVAGMPGTDDPRAFGYFAGAVSLVMVVVAIIMWRKRWL